LVDFNSILANQINLRLWKSRVLPQFQSI